MQKGANVVLPAGKPYRFLLGEKIKKRGKDICSVYRFRVA